jgi:hypothetical protein
MDAAHHDDFPAEPSGLRPYLLTNGRAQPAVPALELEAQVGTTEAGHAAVDQLTYEHRDIVVLCRRPIALAELAARLGLHIGVVRVLAGDLIQSGYLSARRPRAGLQGDILVMERVLRGLESIR